MSQNMTNQSKKRTLKAMTNIYSSAGHKNKPKNSDLDPNSPSRPTKEVRLRGINSINIDDKDIVDMKNNEKRTNSGKVDDYAGSQLKNYKSEPGASNKMQRRMFSGNSV